MRRNCAGRYVSLQLLRRSRKPKTLAAKHCGRFAFVALLARVLQLRGERCIMDKTNFRLKVAGVALLLASSIVTVVIVAQRPQASAPSGSVNATALHVDE